MKVKALDTGLEGGLEVVSLATGSDGRIYGGLTGLKGHLLCEYDPGTGAVRDLGDKVVSANEVYKRDGTPYTQKIHHALDTLPDGRLAGGTGQNYGYGAVHKKISEDEGGHVFVYDPKTEQGRDLGVPVPHMWIIATCTSPDGSQLFGMTYFHNDFFAVDLRTGDVLFADQVHGACWGDSACSHTIVCDREGIVYGSCSEGCIFTYDSNKRELTETDVRLPGEGARRIDALMLGENGMVYGGVWENGIVFSLEPRTLKLRELCRPVDGPRLPALVWRDGCIYGCAGGGPQYGTRGAILFECDPTASKHREVGPIRDEQSGIEGQRVHAMTVGRDGTIYAGETGAVREPRKQDHSGDIEAGMHPYLYIIDV